MKIVMLSEMLQVQLNFREIILILNHQQIVQL
jgi:hypothetical protein